jgi:hypothetical protein
VHFVFSAQLPHAVAYVCPAGLALTYRMTTQEGDKKMRRYWTSRRAG